MAKWRQKWRQSSCMNCDNSIKYISKKRHATSDTADRGHGK
jgi:hypothetical protein